MLLLHSTWMQTTWGALENELSKAELVSFIQIESDEQPLASRWSVNPDHGRVKPKPNQCENVPSLSTHPLIQTREINWTPSGESWMTTCDFTFPLNMRIQKNWQSLCIAARLLYQLASCAVCRGSCFVYSLHVVFSALNTWSLPAWF